MFRNWDFFYKVLIDTTCSFSQAPDNEVVYEVVGDEHARGYFSVNADSGQVYLTRSLILDDAELYTVSTTCLHLHIDGLMQDCSNTSALRIELLQSCAKPLIWIIHIV